MLAYRGKPVEDLPHEETVIWSCTLKDCKGWIRDDFSFESVPVCSICQSPMVRSVKMLPTIINTNKRRS
ncbi:cold-shock protein [Cohnella lubricantis]|uniref:Cold-shock protein n=1 Tax=Cohnella lubricantis TaxID=2163172 RepID=A0A841T9Q5_9BACL|nr:cold-shock protein [Cohnella lubricantis]MBB6678034.1 cold-shock protein [Cohnella lubricantis]MBP2120010.1 hypothetical protein [Cohnella lubricantis]